MKRSNLLLLAVALLLGATPAAAQVTAAQVTPGYLTTSVNVCKGTNSPCFVPAFDPCKYAAKQSVVVNITTATTTQIIAVSGSTTPYICGISLSIAPSATSADTAQFEYGGSTTCTSATTMTGSYGAGDLTTATGPLSINYGGENTIMQGAASSGICIVSSGTTVNIQGLVTFVQQ